jgi:hypothetical protein
MQLVDLADEYELTTAEAIDVCLAAGIAADSSDTLLDAAQVTAWRSCADQQRSWKAQADEAKVLARQAAEAAAAKRSSFGPIPPVPWDHSGASTSGITIAPPTNQPSGSDDGDWGGDSTRQVSLYAAAALALSVVSLIFPFVPAMLSIPLALYARGQIERSKGTVTGDKLAQAALVVSGIGVLLWLALLGAVIYHDQQDRTARSGGADLQVDTQTIAWDQIKKGDCVRLPHGDVSVASWQGVSCASPHEGEVFASLKTPANLAAKFPGRGPMYAAAKEQCTIEFQNYVGIPYRDSELVVAAYLPTAGNWANNDDRSFGCIVHEDGFGLINGSLAGAKR